MIILINQPDGTAYHSGYALENNRPVWVGYNQGTAAGNNAILKIPLRIPVENAAQWNVVVLEKATFDAILNKTNSNEIKPTAQPPDKKVAQQQINQIQQQQQNIDKQMNYQDVNNPAVLPIEQTNGQISVARVENAKGGKGTGETIVISLNNNVGSNPLVLLLGGLADMFSYVFSFTEQAAGATIGGDYGIKTMDIYNSMIRAGVAIRIKGRITFTATTAAGAAAPVLYGQTTLSLLTVNGVKGVQRVNQPFDFQNGYRGDQLDLSIRHYDDYDFLLTPRTGLLFTFPVGYTFQMSARAYSAAGGYIMDLL